MSVSYTHLDVYKRQECILYPGNLPHAWEHTPMKYSALEVLSTNLPTVSMRYEDAIEKYMEFPKMEWICKMGLNKIAKGIINSRYSGYQTGKVNVKGNTTVSYTHLVPKTPLMSNYRLRR